MMKDRGIPDDVETVQIDITYEIYLKQRDEPINFLTTFSLRKDLIDVATPVEDVMQMATAQVLATIDVVREHRFMLSNSRFNKGIFMTDEIQAFTILAPSEDTIMKAMEAV